MPTQEEVLDALRQVLDPEIHLNIVELEMVKDVAIRANEVEVLIALTVPGCPLATTIKGDVQKALMKLGVTNVSVQTTSMTQEELTNLRAKLQKRIGGGTASTPYAASPSGIDRLGKKGIENIIAVVSGKGGVGKSFVTSCLAAELRKSGYEVGVLDSDITGPSIAKVLGVTSRPMGGPSGIIPVGSKSGIKVMSLNLLLDDPEKPAIWRGPIVNSLIRQLYNDVDWGDLHYLLIDLPPGTSDAPLTVFQSIPLSGVVVVTTPQDLARMIVTKSVNMARKLNVEVLGVVENMAYAVCRRCGEREYIFGPPKGEDVAMKLEAPFLGSLRIDPRIAALSDEGLIEEYESEEFSEVTRNLRLNISRGREEAPQAMPIAWRTGSGTTPIEKRKFELKPR